MNGEELLKEIKLLSRLKNNWYSMASISEQYMMLQGSDRTGRQILDIALNSGLHPNTLNRIMSVRMFFDSVKDQIQDFYQGYDPNDLSYPNLEIVKRLYQTNQDQGIRMLNEVLKGKITFRELRAQYTKLIAENIDNASSQQLAKIQGKNFKSLAFEAIKSAANEIFSGQIITIGPPQLRLLTIDAVAYELTPSGEDLMYAGFEFVSYREQANWNTLLDTLLYRSVFFSNFFKRFWIIFSENSGVGCTTGFVRILRLLGCPSIGVATLLETGRLKIVHSPTGDPIQDLSRRLETFLKRRSELLSTRPESKNNTVG